VAAQDELEGKRHFLAGSRPDLRFDQVDAVNHLGDGVLDLDARIGFHEIEFLVFVDEEFEGPEALIADVLGRVLDGAHHPLAEFLVDERRRRLFDHLLVFPLDGAFPLPKTMTEPFLSATTWISMWWRVGQIFLDIEGGIAERGFGSFWAMGNCSSRCCGVRQIRMPFPPPPAAALMMTG